jgi:cobalamin biosynthesis Co2+ chelatase CbiK
MGSGAEPLPNLSWEIMKMKAKIADGSIVEILVGSSIYVGDDAAIDGKTGPFMVVGFESDAKGNQYPQIDVGEGKLTSLSPESIIKVIDPQVEKIEIDLGGDEKISVPAPIAELLLALKKMNDDLLIQIAKITSGTELEDLKKQVEQLSAELESYKSGDKYKALLEEMDAMAQSFNEHLEKLKAIAAGK